MDQSTDEDIMGFIGDKLKENIVIQRDEEPMLFLHDPHSIELWSEMMDEYNRKSNPCNMSRYKLYGDSIGNNK